MPRRADGYDRYGFSNRTVDELQQERRNLATGLAFLASGSPARAPVHARLDAVETELGRRATDGHGGPAMNSVRQEPVSSPEAVAIELHPEGGAAAQMKEPTRTLLVGSQAEVEKKAHAASRLLGADQRVTGMRLCDLALALAMNLDVRVWIVTYSGSSQVLEVTLQGALQCGAVTVSRHSSGGWCAIGLSQWAPSGADPYITSTAGLITAIDAVLIIGRKPDDMQTAELICAYWHARALARFLPTGSLAIVLARWIFTARQVLEARGENIIDPGHLAGDGT